MSPMTTLPPSATSIRACAAPIPRAPPLMSATLPSTRPMRCSPLSLSCALIDVEQSLAGDQWKVQRRPDSRWCGHHRGNRIDHPACAGRDGGVVVITPPAGRADVDGVRRLADDLHPVGTPRLCRLRPVRGQVFAEPGDVVDDDDGLTLDQPDDLETQRGLPPFGDVDRKG